MRILRALARAFTGFDWVLTPPSGPCELGVVIPLQRSTESEPDAPSVPLSRQERKAFLRIVRD